MKRQLHRCAALGLACCLLLVGAGLALGQTETRTRRTEVRTGTHSAHHVRRLSTVMGSRVVLERGSAVVGKVDDVIVNENGCIDFLVVTYHDNFILVPWSAATVNFEQRVVRLDITRDRLRDIPTFARDRWPDVTDTRYMHRVYSAFGVEGSRRGRRTGAQGEGGRYRTGTRTERGGTEGRTERNGTTGTRTERNGTTGNRTERNGTTGNRTERNGTTGTQTERNGTTGNRTERNGTTGRTNRTEPPANNRTTPPNSTNPTRAVPPTQTNPTRTPPPQ